MRRPLLALAVVSAALALNGCSSSSSTTCGAGTTQQGDTCVPSTPSGAAGSGTAGSAAVTCGAGTTLKGSTCVSNGAAGSSGTAGSGGAPISCGTGTVLKGNQCVPTGGAGAGGSSGAGGAGTGGTGTGGTGTGGTGTGGTGTGGTGTGGTGTGGTGTGGTGTGGTGTGGAASGICGPGTVLQNGQCVIAPTAEITKARLTFLHPEYDLTKPAVLNSAVPIKFGVTAHSQDDTKPAKTKATVFFYFQEATPVDPANPARCSSSQSLTLTLTGDGTEQLATLDLLPSNECQKILGANPSSPVVVGFDFDFGMKNASIDYPGAVLSTAAAGDMLNQACRSGGTQAAPTGLGCATQLTLAAQPTVGGMPGLDVALMSLVPESSIMTLWPPQQDPDVPVGKIETPRPSLSVAATLTIYGKDPDEHAVDLANLPPEVAGDPTAAMDFTFGLSAAELAALDDLPAPAEVTYEIAPTDGPDTAAFMPLAIDDPSSVDADVHVASIPLPKMEGGALTRVTHDLFIEGALATKLATTWAKYDEFQIRGCVHVPFAEVGNEGEEDEAAAQQGVDNQPETAANDCKTFKVKLVRATVPAGAANSFAFDMNWQKDVGSNDTVQLAGNLTTSNQLNLNGATSSTEGKVTLASKYLGSLDIIRGYGKAGALTTLASSYVDTGVDAFGTNIWGYQAMGNSVTSSTEFMAAKSYSFPVFSYGVGPIGVSVTVGIGGNVGVKPTFTVTAMDGGNASIPELAMATSSGSVVANFTPTFGLTGNATGGFNGGIFRVGVEANVQIIQVSTPLVATLNWGVTQQMNGAVSQITVVGNTTWDMTLDWCNVEVNGVGKVGIGWFSKSFNKNIWRLQNPQTKINLLNRDQAVLVLE